MYKINVDLKDRSYPIYITTEYDKIRHVASSIINTGKVAIITDTNVEKLQFEQFISSFQHCNLRIYKFVLEAGEKSKNLDTVYSIYEFLKNNRFERGDTLLALGGGVVGDIVGFVAATFLRGINFIQVPTSLLAQIDSSVGGKNGVNYDGIKNMIGTFYQPQLVYINVNVLRTLPHRELVSGLAEIVVHCIIASPKLFSYVESNLSSIFSYDEDVLLRVVRENCAIKCGVVENDEKDTGVRAILNFGHTIGHALESVYSFKYLHGECISVGMIGAFKIARSMGIVDEKTMFRVIELLKKIRLPVKFRGKDINKVLDKIYYDKKTMQDRIVFILPHEIGEVFKYYIDDVDLIKRVLEEICDS